MGKTRVCGATCHHANGKKCRCWCGGVFHGSAGKDARDAFAREFGVERLPTTKREFLENTGQGELFAPTGAGDEWRARVARAVAEREGKRRAKSDV